GRRLLGLLGAPEPLAVHLAADAVGLGVLDARRVASGLDPQPDAEIERLLVRQAQLTSELVDPDLRCQCLDYALPSWCGEPILARTAVADASVTSRRSALASALRRSACSRHVSSGHSQAPRPGADRSTPSVASGRTTTRRSAPCGRRA